MTFISLETVKSSVCVDCFLCFVMCYFCPLPPLLLSRLPVMPLVIDWLGESWYQQFITSCYIILSFPFVVWLLYRLSNAVFFYSCMRQVNIWGYHVMLCHVMLCYVISYHMVIC